MFAVVGQDAVVALSQSRAGARHDFVRVETLVLMADSDRPATREALERNRLHRTATQAVSQARIVDDASATNVDAVVRVERASSDEMGAEGRFMSGFQRRILHAGAR
jgi:hypothetical protein